MLTAFDRLLKVGDKTNYKHNSEPAIFAYNDLVDTETVSVIFERAKELIVMQGETEIITRRPVAYMQQNEIDNLNIPNPVIGDQLTIQNIIYDIVAVPDDGHNEIEMHLEKE